MKNQPGTNEDHDNQLETMKNRESQPGSMKKQPGTLKNHECAIHFRVTMFKKRNCYR